MNIKTNRWLDKYVALFAVFVLSVFKIEWFKKPEKPGTKVLFIQWWGMGESLLTLPAIKWYKENDPTAEVHVMTTSRVAEVFDQPFIDKVKLFSMSPFGMLWFMIKNFKRYDVVFDMEEYLNSSTITARVVGRYTVGFSHRGRSLAYHEMKDFKTQHMVKNFCDLVGAEYPEKLIPLKTDEVEPMIPKSVGLFFGTAESCTERNWPMEKWIGLYNSLKEKGYVVFFIYEAKWGVPIGGPDHKLTNNLFELAGVLKETEWFVSNDTGPMHLAAAMGTKTIGLFGPNIPELWAPYGQHSIYFPVECSPCIHNIYGDMGGCASNLCMQNIEVEDVLNVIEKGL